MSSRIKPFLAGCSLAGLVLASGGALASETEEEQQSGASEWQSETSSATAGSEQDLSGPEEDIQEAAEVLRQLKQDDSELAQRVAESKAVFIIPDYATASLLVGGSGGEGVLLERSDGEWGNPGFYDVGSIDVGAQAGAAAGTVVMLLMSDEAVQNFRTDTDFSLTAEAGLTIINWSADVAETSEEGDVIVWSDTAGLLAEASVGVGGISWDEEEAAEYYGQQVTAEEVLAGNVQNPHQQVIETEFAEFSGSGQPSSQDESMRSPEDKSMKEKHSEHHEGSSEQDYRR